MFYHSILWSFHCSKQQESLASISCLIMHVYELMILFKLQLIILIISCFIADNTLIKRVKTSTTDVSLTLQTSTSIWITLNNHSETKSSLLMMMMLLLRNLLSLFIASESTHKKKWFRTLDNHWCIRKDWRCEQIKKNQRTLWVNSWDSMNNSWKCV